MSCDITVTCIVESWYAIHTAPNVSRSQLLKSIIPGINMIGLRQNSER